MERMNTNPLMSSAQHVLTLEPWAFCLIRAEWVQGRRMVQKKLVGMGSDCDQTGN